MDLVCYDPNEMAKIWDLRRDERRLRSMFPDSKKLVDESIDTNKNADCE